MEKGIHRTIGYQVEIRQIWVTRTRKCRSGTAVVMKMLGVCSQCLRKRNGCERWECQASGRISELPLVWGDKKFRHGPPESCDRRVPDSGDRALSNTDRKGRGRSGSRAGACLLGTRTTARGDWEGSSDKGRQVP